MTYIAITQGTAEWIIAKSGLLDALHILSVTDFERTVNNLAGKEWSEGPVVISVTRSRDLICVWNRDYLTGTGDESWGFARVSGEFSVSKRKDISREVFEREIYIINQRLQGYLIDGAFIHRSYPNGAHTCLAGRGSEARQVNVGYFENKGSAGAGHQSVVVVGPEYNFQQLSDEARDAGRSLPKLVASANNAILPERKPVAAPKTSLSWLRSTIRSYNSVPNDEGVYDKVENLNDRIPLDPKLRNQVIGLNYEGWMKSDSPLNDAQRKIIMSGAIDSHPIRILGPAGSGKSLLLQLLALRCLSRDSKIPCRALYLVHNTAMGKLVKERFDILDPDGSIRSNGDLQVKTLSDYALEKIGLVGTDVIDKDAQSSKNFQLEQILECLKEAKSQSKFSPEGSDSIFFHIEDEGVAQVLAGLVAYEISISIKGHGLENDRKRYVGSERSFSRFHGILSQRDREFVFDIFENYKRRIFDGFGLLDSDDIALSLYGQLKIPVWELRRGTQGYDYIFVDEAQLFNENEKRVFPLLSNGHRNHVPVVLALDEAQDPRGAVSSGLASLGIVDAASESLSSIHRSSQPIVDLAFFFIQQTTDLFTADFPDFTGARSIVTDGSDDSIPNIETATSNKYGKFVLKRVRELRRNNIWRIAIVSFTDGLFEKVQNEFEKEGSDLPRYDLLRRGEKLPSDSPVVVLTKPDYIGGQEFDAVLLLGLEQGVVPPRFIGNPILAASIEQQLLRELYLCVSRAIKKVTFIMSENAVPTMQLGRAIAAGKVK